MTEEILIKRFNGLMTKFARQHRQILKMAWKHPDTPHIQHFKKMMCGPGGFFSQPAAN